MRNILNTLKQIVFEEAPNVDTEKKKKKKKKKKKITLISITNLFFSVKAFDTFSSANCNFSKLENINQVK